MTGLLIAIAIAIGAALWAVAPALFADRNARALVYTLDRDEWEAEPRPFGGPPFYLVHPSGLRLWIANEGYALHVKIPGRPNLWEVSVWCLLGGSPSQRLVWGAVKRWASRNLLRDRPDIEAFLRKGGSRR